MGNSDFAPISWSRNSTQTCFVDLEKLDICKQHGSTPTCGNLLKLETFSHPQVYCSEVVFDSGMATLLQKNVILLKA